MKSLPRAACAATIGLALALPAAAEEPSAVDRAWLAGTFGTVLGTDPYPATADPDDRPLATWMREETLELVVEPPLADGDAVTFTATAMDGSEAVELPVAGDRWVTGPATAGRHTVVASIERSGSAPSRHAWLLDVGDRPGTWESRLQMPALEARLVSAAGSVAGERGHGCLTGFCQEAGYRPPAATLEPLPVAVGELLTLELDDGSAIVHWQGRAEPAGDTRSETRTAERAFDAPVAGPVLEGLEPDAAGEWLLEVRADYDRDRGWQWYLFRLVAE